MTTNIEHEIKRAKEFRDKIEQLVLNRREIPTGDRNNLLIAYWSLLFDFHRGVLCLISHNFLGSAFALIRPIIEAAVRAHVAILGSDEDVRKLLKDEYRTDFANIGQWIDTSFETEGLFHDFLSTARKGLHSYTHAGSLQVQRRFSGNQVAANYSDGEIAELIHSSTSAIFIANTLVTRHFGFDEEWEQNSKLWVEELDGRDVRPVE